jgi:hypothetical protein
MEPLNATAIERDKRQPKAQQMLGLADDEYVNLTDRPEPANEVRPGKPWRMLQLGERGHAAPKRATQQSVVAQPEGSATKSCCPLPHKRVPSRHLQRGAQANDWHGTNRSIEEIGPRGPLKFPAEHSYCTPKTVV